MGCKWEHGFVVTLQMKVMLLGFNSHVIEKARILSQTVMLTITEMSRIDSELKLEET